MAIDPVCVGRDRAFDEPHPDAALTIGLDGRDRAVLELGDAVERRKRPAFEPIPALAFDPLDRRSREGWVRETNWERREPVLERMLTRLSTDADMPPTDSPEHEHFRVKDAAAFAEAKTFLEAELAKLKRD